MYFPLPQHWVFDLSFLWSPGCRLENSTNSAAICVSRIPRLCSFALLRGPFILLRQGLPWVCCLLWRMQGNEQKGEREGWRCKCQSKKIKSQTLRKISRQASSLPYPVLPVDDPPPFWQMLVPLRLEDSKSDWKTWLFFAPFDLLFWIFLLFSYLASILTIVPHSSFRPALQSDPSNVQLHLLRDMELCFFHNFW